MKAADVFDLTGYGAVVTGGASGIGLSFVETMVEHGARVTLLDIDSVRVKEHVGRLQRAGYDVRGTVVDVTDRKALDQAFSDTNREYGRLDVVFANAGIDPGIGFVTRDRSNRPLDGAIENYGSDRWEKAIAVNLDAVFTTVSAAARHMKPRREGSIVVTTSILAFEVEPAVGAAYMAAKAGSAHFMRYAALELAAYNIRVNAIAPGFVATNYGGGELMDPLVQRAAKKIIPLGRTGSTDDMKGLALFLASPASSYITGSQITIDGGLTLVPAS
jgi:NAD(P)-dependent dehydrogenase (short-subunit alcohol dehydrogenase family)